MRRAGRTDANQREIVEGLRALGASVAVTSSLGGGFPDLVVGWRGTNHLLEIKAPPGARGGTSRARMTQDERSWHAGWRGRVHVVKSLPDAICAVGMSVAGK